MTRVVLILASVVLALIILFFAGCTVFLARVGHDICKSEPGSYPPPASCQH